MARPQLQCAVPQEKTRVTLPFTNNMVLTQTWVKKAAAILTGTVIVFTPATVIALQDNAPEHQIHTPVVSSPPPIEGLAIPVIGKSLAQIEEESKPKPTATPKPIKKTPPMTPTELTELQREAQTLVIIAWGLSEWDAFDWIIRKESGWNFQAVNKSSAATGLCQSLPAKKMASAGEDYLTNPITQIKWCISYIKQRYKTPTQAKSFHLEHNWF